MAQIIKINSGKFVKDGKVEIDGNLWSIKLPGAGTELKMSKLQRRQEFLAKKVDSGTAIEKDLDLLDEIEDKIYNFFIGIFQDGTKDNKTVTEWVEQTPLAVIMQVFEDIKAAASKQEE